jgi:hypothetical protein
MIENAREMKKDGIENKIGIGNEPIWPNTGEEKNEEVNIEL